MPINRPFAGAMAPAAAALFLAHVALALPMSVAPATARQISAPPRVTAAEAHRLLSAGRIRLIDIRRPSEWRATGVAAGAVAITMHQGVSQFLNTLNQRGLTGATQPIALICAHGVRSRWLRGQLLRRGITNVIDVTDGTLGSRGGRGWKASGLPMRAWP